MNQSGDPLIVEPNPEINYVAVRISLLIVVICNTLLCIGVGILNSRSACRIGLVAFDTNMEIFLMGWLNETLLRAIHRWHVRRIEEIKRRYRENLL